MKRIIAEVGAAAGLITIFTLGAHALNEFSYTQDVTSNQRVGACASELGFLQGTVSTIPAGCNGIVTGMRTDDEKTIVAFNDADGNYQEQRVRNWEDFAQDLQNKTMHPVWTSKPQLTDPNTLIPGIFLGGLVGFIGSMAFRITQE